MAHINYEESIEEIYDTYYKDVYHFLIHFIGNRYDAEDLTQEVFIRVLKSLQRYNSQSSMKTWILSISKHVAIDYLRRKKFYSLFKDGFFNGLHSPEKGPMEMLEAKNKSEFIQVAISSLKPSYRAILILRGINEFSIKETAEILNCSEAKVKVNYHRALKKLQEKLKFQGEEALENAN